MALTFDVVVIGGGIAGVSAALAARARGAAVCLVRAAPGATALASGAWVGPLRAELRTALADRGLPFEVAGRPLGHERGYRVHADFAAASHIAASGDPVIAGFAGLPHFNATTLARLWYPDAPPRAHTLHLAGTPAAGWSPPALAAHIERNPSALIEALRAANVRAAILPAVLGIDNVADVMKSLADAGVEVTEALAATPSIPGWRLQQALDRTLAAASIHTINGRASMKAAAGTRAQQLAVGEELLHARSFVLATGKYLAGGMSADETFREHVFDLPIWLEQLGDVFTAPDVLPLTDPVRTADQPLLAAGVHVDAEQRSIDRAHDVVYENVFVAGTIRSDWATAERGLGHCAEDGWNAGERASA